MVTSSSGCGYGSGRNNAASMTLKSAVETPMPSASVKPARIAKARLAAQLPERVLHVLEHGLHHASSSHVVAAVLDDREVAEPLQRGPPRRVRIQAVACVLVGAHRHVEPQLLANFVGRGVAPEERAQSGDRDPDGEHQRA